MTKAALSINELSELWSPELNNIDVLEQDQRVILHAKTDLERNADGMLSRGLESQNQSQIGIALQVIRYLNFQMQLLFACLSIRCSVRRKMIAS